MTVAFHERVARIVGSCLREREAKILLSKGDSGFHTAKTRSGPRHVVGEHLAIVEQQGRHTACNVLLHLSEDCAALERMVQATGQHWDLKVTGSLLVACWGSSFISQSKRPT